MKLEDELSWKYKELCCLQQKIKKKRDLMNRQIAPDTQISDLVEDEKFLKNHRELDRLMLEYTKKWFAYKECCESTGRKCEDALI